MGAKNALGLLIAAVVLALLAIVLSDGGAVGYRDCDTTTCHAVVR